MDEKAEILDRLAAWISLAAWRHPWVTLGSLALLLVLSVVAATRLSVDTDSSKMLDPRLPFQERAQAVNAAFPAVKNTVLVVVRGENHDAVEAVVAALAARLTARSEAIEAVFAPSADPFLLSHGLLYDDLESVRETLGRLSQSSNLLAELREDRTVDGFLAALDRAMTLAGEGGTDPAALDPLMQASADVFQTLATGASASLDWSGLLDEESGRLTRVVTVEPVLDFTRLNPAKAALGVVAEEVAALDPTLSRLVEIGVTGDPALRAQELQSVTATLPISLGASLLLVAAILALALGRAGRVVLALSCVVATLILTTGAAALAVGSLNLISVAFVVLMVGLGIDFAIHFMAHLDEDAGRGLHAQRAIEETARSIGGALVLSAITTSLAFLAFTTTDFIGMAQLGVIGGIGVPIALLVALTLVPAMVALKPSLLRGAGPLRVPIMGRGPARLAAGVVALAALGALWFAPQARFEADPMALRAADAASVTAFDWLADEAETAPLRLSVLTDDPAEAEAVAVEARALPAVRSAAWLGDLVPEDQAAKLDEIDLAYPSISFALTGTPVDLAQADIEALPARLAAWPTPGGPALAAALTDWRAAPDVFRGPAADAALFRFFPQLLERIELLLEAGEVTTEALPQGLVTRFRGEEGVLRVEIAPEGDMRDPAARAAFVSGVATAIPAAGGPPAQIAGATETVAGAMAMAAGIALLATALAAWITLRSARQMAAILVPLVLAAGVTLGASGLFGIPFNYANVIILPLMIGIGVDTGIHLAVRASRSVESVFSTSTPRAALASALTTIGAFGTLALSDHRGTASMGVMLVIALSVSLVLIFTL
ncbi:MAG: MMPL family transporter, partial [Pseudomonadota bacterium]